MDRLDPTVDLVHFPDDSTYTGKDIGYREVTDGTNTFYLPTTLLVDKNGVILDPRQTSDEETHLLLRALIVRLDILNAAVDKNYEPPDDYAEDY